MNKEGWRWCIRSMCTFFRYQYGRVFTSNAEKRTVMRSCGHSDADAGCGMRPCKIEGKARGQRA